MTHGYWIKPQLSGDGFWGVPLSHSCSASLTWNIVNSRYIHGLLLRHLRGPKRGEACTRGQAGGKGFEKLSREGFLGFENRHNELHRATIRPELDRFGGHTPKGIRCLGILLGRT